MNKGGWTKPYILVSTVDKRVVFIHQREEPTKNKHMVPINFMSSKHTEYWKMNLDSEICESNFNLEKTHNSWEVNLFRLSFLRYQIKLSGWQDYSLTKATCCQVWKPQFKKEPIAPSCPLNSASMLSHAHAHTLVYTRARTTTRTHRRTSAHTRTQTRAHTHTYNECAH